MSEQSLFRDMVERLRARGVDIPEAEALAVERDLHAHWGGQRHYIPKEVARQPHVVEQVIADATTTMPTAEITKRHGISRATLYRMLKRSPGGGQGA